VKAPFRFYRGELNGFYLLKFLLSRNDSVDDIISELVYHAKMVWKLSGEEVAGELPAREDDVVGIAKMAGILRPYQYIENNIGSIRFTDSHIVGGAERSERGLFDVVNERFVFAHVDSDEYAEDIFVEATSSLKMSLVPDDQVPVGYVPYGVDIYDAAGVLIPGNILSSPPVDDTPYSEYYGEKFLHTEEIFTSEAEMPIDMFKLYYECIMRIRSNGASIAELLNLTEIICADYVTGIEVVQTSYYYTLSYDINTASSIDNKSGRFATWLAVCEKRFKDFVITER
jgi:hypothetical protein